MTASGFRVRVIGLVFVFKSASLVLKQDPTCIRKPMTNTFEKSIKFLHWLFLVVLDGFRSFQIVLGHFRSFLDRFRSFQHIPHFSKYPFIDQYNWKEIDFPAQPSKDWKTFESNNKSITLNVLYIPYYNTKKNKTCIQVKT